MNPILLDFPDQFESERLIIRAPRVGDGALVQPAVIESLAELQPWMPWATPDTTVDDSEASVRGGIAKWILRDDLRLHILKKSDGSFVGGSGLHRIDWEVPSFEIGYWVRTSCQGQGYITEAVRAITDFAFETLNANRVEIRCATTNERSAAVATRAGFPLEAKLANDARTTSGELRDTYIFALTRKDRF